MKINKKTTLSELIEILKPVLIKPKRSDHV